MQNSPYNNPMLAQGLSSLVQSFIGNPQAEAQSQEAASRALLNNQTAQFRDAIGETGLSGDLAAMMIRSLQAGPDYARVAPGIGDNAVRFGAMGFGRPELTPQGGLASMIMGAMAPRSGGGGGRSSGGGGSQTAAKPMRAMTASDVTNMRSLAKQLDLPPEAVFGAVQEGLASGEFSSVGEAIMDVVSRVGEVPGEPVVTNPGGTMLSRAFSGVTGIGGDPSTWEPDAVTVPTTRGIVPRQPAAPAGQNADAVSALNQAREAIARGADPKAVAARLAELGIDPGGL
jgi:hypothetical protein